MRRFTKIVSRLKLDEAHELQAMLQKHITSFKNEVEYDTSSGSPSLECAGITGISIDQIVTAPSTASACASSSRPSIFNMDNAVTPNSLDCPHHDISSSTVSSATFQKNTLGTIDQEGRTPSGLLSDHGPHTTMKVLKPFYCTYCKEINEETGFGSKNDWKRHQEKFHSETGLKWLCPVSNCNEFFYTSLGFTAHREAVHKGLEVPVKKQQRPHLYACGFGPCRELNDKWKLHSNHVAHCMQKGYAWNFDQTFHNLLQSKAVSFEWKKVVYHMGHEYVLDTDNLKWDVKTARHLRTRLENFHRELDVPKLLEEISHAGKLVDHSPVPRRMPNLPVDHLHNLARMAQPFNHRGNPTFGPPFGRDSISPALMSAEANTNSPFQAQGSAHPQFPHGFPGHRDSYVMEDMPDLEVSSLNRSVPSNVESESFMDNTIFNQIPLHYQGLNRNDGDLGFPSTWVPVSFTPHPVNYSHYDGVQQNFKTSPPTTSP